MAPRRRLRLALPRLGVEEEARDCLAQAQAALSDEHRGAALRALERLHELLVPPLDQLLQGLRPAPPQSCALGLLPLFSELPDLDVEREAPAELLLYYAARCEAEDGPAPLAEANIENIKFQWRQLEQRLWQAAWPEARWWRRLVRGAAGGLGDRARVQVQRGASIVFERLPGPGAGDDEDGLCETDLGDLEPGDRLTLQVQVPLPGRLAVLHAAGDEGNCALTVLLPAGPAEEAARRALEVVEVSGELGPADEGPEQALVVLWAPELLPASWYLQVIQRQRLPPEARLWRYRYRVTQAAGAQTPAR